MSRWSRIADCAAEGFASRNKAQRRKARAHLLAEIARRLAGGLPLPPGAIEYARTGGMAKPPKSEARAKRPKRTRQSRSNAFYRSPEWRQIRYGALEKAKGQCQCCGARGGGDTVLHVDHIEPLSKAWHRRLDPANLQVLCQTCNEGKGNRFSTDWR